MRYQHNNYLPEVQSQRVLGSDEKNSGRGRANRNMFIAGSESQDSFEKPRIGSGGISFGSR